MLYNHEHVRMKYYWSQKLQTQGNATKRAGTDYSPITVQKIVSVAVQKKIRRYFSVHFLQCHFYQTPRGVARYYRNKRPAGDRHSAGRNTLESEAARPRGLNKIFNHLRVKQNHDGVSENISVSR